MKILFTFLTCCWIVIQSIHSRMHRFVVDDTLHPYTIDKSVPSFSKYFSQEYLEFEEIDDDTLKMGGYGLCIESLDPKLPLQLAVRSQYLENSAWREGPIQLLIPSMCGEFLNPSRFWYNLTKLWTNCPPQKGDKWLIEDQIMNAAIDIPPSFSKGPWRGYLLFTQGLLISTNKFGMMVKVEFTEIV